MTENSGLKVVWGMRMAGRDQNEREWVVSRGGRVGSEWDVRKWKNEIDKEVKCVGLNKWKNEIWDKRVLWNGIEKVAPMYERWYDGSSSELGHSVWM